MVMILTEFLEISPQTEGVTGAAPLFHRRNRKLRVLERVRGSTGEQLKDIPNSNS